MRPLAPTTPGLHRSHRMHAGEASVHRRTWLEQRCNAVSKHRIKQMEGKCGVNGPCAGRPPLPWTEPDSRQSKESVERQGRGEADQPLAVERFSHSACKQREVWRAWHESLGRGWGAVQGSRNPLRYVTCDRVHAVAKFTTVSSITLHVSPGPAWTQGRLAVLCVGKPQCVRLPQGRLAQGLAASIRAYHRITVLVWCSRQQRLR